MLIHKYYPDERITFFENFMVRFTPPDGMNDPFESLPQIRDSKEETAIALASRHKGKDHEITLFSELYAATNDPLYELAIAKGYRARASEVFGIFSVADDWDNILLWSHYASCHEGFSVSFDAEHPFFTQHGVENQLGLQKVTNRAHRAKVSYVTEEEEIDTFSIKSHLWEYENERRLLRYLNEADQVLNDEIHLFQIPCEAIKAITFGCESSEQLRFRVAFRIGMNPKCDHIDLFHATIHPAKFELTRRPIKVTY